MPMPSDFALLGVPAGADQAAVRHAFLQAVKAARPDRGGDPERYREVIAAYRRLRPSALPDLDVHIDLTVEADQARTGGARTVQLPTGRTLRVTLPADLKTGRTLRLRRQGLSAPGRWGDVYLRVIVAEPVRSVEPISLAAEARERAAEMLRPTASVLLRRFAGTWAA
jgi:DnaJ-class molecular chaperone